MAIKEWLFRRSNETKYREVSCAELFEAAQDYKIRSLAFWTCVNMIANAVGKCEFRTFENGKETKGQEYYLWNVEPNANQNSTVFIHKLVASLYEQNEALIVEAHQRGKNTDMLLVADSWTAPEEQAVKQNEYQDVIVSGMTFNKTFKESDVLHLTLNAKNVKPVIDGLYASYARLINAAIKNYEWQSGQHWKVHVSQSAQGGDNWAAMFQELMTKQFQPFLSSSGAVLPEFDGYQYENVSAKQTGTLETRDIRKLIDDIFDFTAKAFMIPPVLLGGEVAGTQDALSRWLTLCIDPLCDQLQEEINRKRYGYDGWSKGNYLQVDTSKLIHFDLFANATNIEKLVGAGFSYNDIQRSIGGAQIDEPWANEHFFTKNFDLASNFLASAGA